MRRFDLYLLSALALLSGCRKDVSGSYLASDSASVCWLQLVRTPDNHLSGQILASVLGSDGRIEHSSASLIGAVNGDDVTLTGGGFLGMATTTLSGKFNGDALTLTGVQSTPVSLRRASLADYQELLGQQVTRSQAVISARAAAAARQRTLEVQKNFVAELDQLVGRMERFDAEADVHLGRFPNAERGYEAISAKVNEYVSRERQLVANPARAVDRSQLDVAAIQASLGTDEIQFQVQSLQSSLDANVVPLVNEATNLERGCRQGVPPGEGLTTTEIEAHQSACNRLLSAAPTFHQKYAEVTAGLNHLEEVYRREKSAQAHLLAMAEKMD